MADDRKTRDRPVQRWSERQRLEEQLWSLAYEQVWPVIRKKPKAGGAKANQQPRQRSRLTPKEARRA
jgi:hypothetical protein